jgi:hypothetical protein
MAIKLRDLSVEQFRGLIHDTVKQVLRELLEDPDAGLALQPAFVRRLRRSLTYLEKGGKTISAEDMAKRLGLKW